MMMNIYNIKETVYAKLFNLFYKNSFLKFGKGVKIISPLRINGYKNISIGNNVLIQYKTWLAALPLTDNECELVIGDGTAIGSFNHIFDTKLIKKGNRVLT